MTKQNRLSPFTVQSLTMSSLIHLFNVNSDDTGLAQRSEQLHRLNIHFLNQMAMTTTCSIRAIRFLKSVRNDGTKSSPQHLAGEVFGVTYEDESERLPGTQGIHIQEIPQVLTSVPDNDTFSDEFFDWYQLPLNDGLLFDGMFPESMWNEMSEQNQEQSWGMEDMDPTASSFLTSCL